MLDMLKKYNIRPIIVFDGRKLPLKINTEKQRSGLKEKNKEKGFEYLKMGKL